jgi:Ca-activated chloride channel homolog
VDEIKVMPTKSKLMTLTLLLLVTLGLSVTNAQRVAEDVSQRNQKRPRTVHGPQARVSKISKPAADEGEPEVIRVETNLVNTVFTAVDRDRHFITTLRADDLRIYENDSQQTISLFERETDRPLTLVILVDTSKSQEHTLPEEKKAAKAFIRDVVRPDKDKVAIISFTGVPRIEQPLTENLSKLNHAIDRLRVELPPDDPTCDEERSVQEDPRCYTSIWDSVWESANEVLAHGDENSRRAVILLSDGVDTSSTIKRQDAIDAAVKNNVAVYSIGIGDPEFYKVEQNSLGKISNSTGGRAFFPRDESELSAVFAQIQEELRSQYVIAYSPQNKSRDGSQRRIRMELVNPQLRKQKLQLIYRQEYFAPKS